MLVDRRRPGPAADLRLGGAAHVERAVADRLSRRHAQPRRPRRALQGRQLLPGARGRAAGRAALGRRQPARDAEGPPGDVSRARCGSSSTSRSTRTGLAGADAQGVRRARAAGHRARRRVRSSDRSARCRCGSRSRLTSPPSSGPGVLWLDGATVVEREPRLDAPLAAAEAAVRDAPARARSPPSGRCTSASASIRPRRRPSSEALLRRVRKGDPLPRINSMVDVCNWCSLEFQLPYGLYDAARIEGDVELRIGRDGESYAGIRKDDVHVGGRITLADCGRAVRQSDVGLGADDGDDGDDAGVAGRLRAARRRATPISRPCSTAPRAA